MSSDFVEARNLLSGGTPIDSIIVRNTVRIFEKQPDGTWLTKVHIFNAY